MQEKSKQSGGCSPNDELLIAGRSIESWSIVDRFEFIVDRYPQRIAVVSGNERWTYAQLNQRANQIAHALVDSGVLSEEPVGIALPKSCDLIAAVLGILKAGGAYVPFVDNQPIARVVAMREQVKCRRVIGVHGYFDELYSESCQRITTDSCNAYSVGNPDQSRGCNQLAYILFTSGSTGLPKGVMIEDAGVIRLVCGQSYLPFGPEFHYLFAAPMSFDVSTLEIFTPLLHGAKLVVVPDGEPDSALIRELCHREQVQSTCMAFGLFASLFESCPEIFERMPVVAVGGEQVGFDIISKAQSRLPSTQFINAYGPTEATMLATTYRVPDLRDAEFSNIPIGCVLNRMDAYILNDAMELVADGVSGELCLGGVGIARGYLGMEQLTGERFVEGCAGLGKKQRLYRTGDVVYKDKAGDIVFVGRVDDQVKIHGYRIELGEIESVAQHADGVLQAVAITIGQGDDTQVALGVVYDSDINDDNMLREDLRKRLPHYMVPRIIHSFERIPLNRNGKVDRRAIHAVIELLIQTPIQEHAQKPLETSTESWLGKIIGEVLEVEDVYSTDNFLHLGGHSLRAVVLCTRIRDEYRVSMQLSKLYQLGTVQAIGLWIDQHVELSDPTIETHPFGDSVLGESSPLSFNQQRLWVLNQLDPDDISYIVSVRLAYHGKINHACFNKAWEYVCHRHDVLRTRISIVDDSPVQYVDEEIDISVCWNKCEQETDAEILHRAADDSAISFDLQTGPLVRCCVYVQRNQASVLVSMHHIISDAWSCDVIQRELNAAYQTCVEGREFDGQRLPVQYAAFSRWQRALPASKVYAEDLAYWKKQLHGFESVELPLDAIRSATPSSNGERVSRVMNEETLLQVQSAANKLGVTTYSYMLALFKVWIHRLTGFDDIVVGTPIANREWAQVEDTVGFFMETAALRTHVSSRDSLGSVVKQVSDTVLEAFDHRDVPFQHIVDAVHAHASGGRNPLFEVFFNQVSMGLDSEPVQGEFVIDQRQLDNNTAKFDLTCYLIQRNSSVEIVFNYRRDLFEQATMEWFIEQYVSLVQHGHENLDTAISQIPVYVKPENSVSEECAFGLQNKPFCSIHEKIHRVVEQFPDRTAVVWESGSLSYAQLWDQSSNIASLLIKQGVREGDRVFASALDSGKMASSILAILRVGAMYIPLDPSWPDQRIEQIARSALSVHAVVDRSMTKRLNEIEICSSIICLDEIKLSDPVDFKNQDVRVGAYTPAYMFFTSGSTGEPKGVVQSHHGVIEHMCIFVDSLGLTDEDCVLQLSSHAFDSAVMDMFGAWFVGATLCVCDVQREDGRSVKAMISTNHVTVFHSTPSVYRWFTETIGAYSPCETVRVVVLGGEPLAQADVQDLNKHFPNCNLFINGLGLTESSLALQFKAHPNELKEYHRWVPVGYSTADSFVRLVDQDGLPTALSGEIEVESDRIALGYWDSNRACVDPIGVAVQGTNRRRFRTGDRGMMRADGAITHMGRLDRQVQVHGCRVEVGEVEAVIKRMDGVRDIAIYADETRTGDHELCGYIVLDDSKEDSVFSKPVTHHALRQYLVLRLPGYMIPTKWKRVESIPYVGGGKVNRLALKDMRELSFECPDRVGKQGQDPHDSKTADEVLQAFRHVLGVKDNGLDDCLFQLGGNSLKAIRVFAILRDQCQTTLPLSTIYRSSTPRTIAQAIDELAKRQKHDAQHDTVCIDLPGDRTGRKVYLIPGIGGQPMGLVPLVEQLPSGCQYIGLQLPGVEQLKTIGQTMQDLASWLIEHMGLAQGGKAPDLIGYSFGGALAFEIALQLQEKGMISGRLILLDTHLPSGLPKKGKAGLLATHAKILLQGGDQGGINYLRSKVFKDQGVEKQANEKGGSNDHQELRPFKLNAKANRAMLGAYVPNRRYAGGVCLMQAVQPRWLQFHKDDSCNGWLSVIEIDQMHKVQINASHLDLFKGRAMHHIAAVISDYFYD